jgi:hypothetical protein
MKTQHPMSIRTIYWTFKMKMQHPMSIRTAQHAKLLPSNPSSSDFNKLLLKHTLPQKPRSKQSDSTPESSVPSKVTRTQNPHSDQHKPLRLIYESKKAAAHLSTAASLYRFCNRSTTLS